MRDQLPAREPFEPKKLNIEAGSATVSVTDNQKQKIELCRANSDRNIDYYLKVTALTQNPP